ncbi:hypothetical protein VNO78_02791 [Psophocarpus tetragonolobus]|uniref:Disease resistance R13L4/SHOC-2-like LRR domain-containing protein n=1 Tax=Psophocarpus tetragonolobus TaxID=3891 RepID=A0AAN9T343_PSOTE
MGCFVSKNADTKASRVARWRSTGIVALRDSKLKTFPDEILELDRVVRTLDLTHNRIVDIPVEISKLINVQRLVLAENLIERLPVNLGKLQSLKLMNLDGNRITSLPDELGQLVRLERLSISGNLLTSLPATIGSLRNLVLLNVSNNKLQSLPESVGSCFSLEELQANDNLIEDLPSSVCNLSHLKSLCLDNNNVKQLKNTERKVISIGISAVYLIDSLLRIGIGPLVLLQEFLDVIHLESMVFPIIIMPLWSLSQVPYYVADIE